MKSKIHTVFFNLGKPTLRFDGFKDENGGHLINYVEIVGEVCEFRRCLGPDGRAKTGGLFVQVMQAELEAGAAERDSDVESLYCGLMATMQLVS